LDLARLGADEGDETLEFGAKVASCVFHGRGCDSRIYRGRLHPLVGRTL